MDYQSFVDKDKTLLIAPAGYGKTYTIVECLKHTAEKQLILTHTHAGVSSIKDKINKANISAKKYSVETISSFAQKYVNAFYVGTDIPEQETREYHPFIIDKATAIFKSPIIKIVIEGTYAGLFVDEYQDCTKPQHEMILALSKSLKTHILGDPLQGIFNFNGDLVNFDTDLSDFERVPDLSTPERWHQNNKVSLGNALKSIRGSLDRQQPIDLNSYSQDIEIINIDERDKYTPRTLYNNKLQELRNKTNVLVIHPVSSNKAPRISFIKRFKGFHLVESIDDPEFYNIAKQSDITHANISEKNISEIVYALLGQAGLDEWFNSTGFKNKRSENDKVRVVSIQKLISHYTSYNDLKNILLSIKNLPKVKCYQVELFNSLIKAISIATTEKISVYEAMKYHRNIIRRSGRKISGKCIGTTLLTKGLEFDTVVILDAHKFNCPKHLYVALTRCCKRLVIFTNQMTLSPYTR